MFRTQLAALQHPQETCRDKPVCHAQLHRFEADTSSLNIFEGFKSNGATRLLSKGGAGSSATSTRPTLSEGHQLGWEKAIWHMGYFDLPWVLRRAVGGIENELEFCILLISLDRLMFFNLGLAIPKPETTL